MKHFLLTECNTCHVKVNLPIDEKQYETIKKTALGKGVLNEIDNFLHVCDIPYPGTIEVIGILKVQCICKGE